MTGEGVRVAQYFKGRRHTVAEQRPRLMHFRLVSANAIGEHGTLHRWRNWFRDNKLLIQADQPGQVWDRLLALRNTVDRRHYLP